MTRAVVIYGDRQIGNAIREGITSAELDMVRAENRRLNAINGVRAEGDEKRWPEIQADLARTYTVKRHGVVYRTLLLAWAMLWLEIMGAYEYLSAWNREA